MKSFSTRLSRRQVLAALASLAATTSPALAETRPPVVVHKDPNCGCCAAWAKHLERAGFPVTIAPTSALAAIKQRLGVPDDLASCHTAEMAGYVLEGHVPVAAILRLLAERPTATGLAVPGMPVGSPGMEGGTPEVYEVVLFIPNGRESYGRYRGDKQV
jgi:hypothetical protein